MTLPLRPRHVDVPIIAGEGLHHAFYFADPDSLEPFDFTGYTGQMEVRAASGDPVILNLSTAVGADGTIEFPSNGVIHLDVDAEVVDLVEVDLATPALYTLLLESPDGERLCWAQGMVARYDGITEWT